MTTDAQFWDKLARRYAANPIKDMTAYEHTLERAGSYLHAGDKALELGAGTGTTALLLAPGVARYTATDISPEMMQIGREKAEAEGNTNVDFVVAPSNAQQFADGSHDAVLAFNLLHLVEDLDSTLSRAQAALKPGGYFISKTVCLAEKGWYVRLAVMAMRAVGKAPFVRFLRIKELERAITAHGFDIVETGNFPANPPSRFIVARKR